MTFITLLGIILVLSIGLLIIHKKSKNRLEGDPDILYIDPCHFVSDIDAEPPKSKGRNNKLKHYDGTIRVMLDMGLSRREIAGHLGVTRQAIDYFIKHHLKEVK